MRHIIKELTILFLLHITILVWGVKNDNLKNVSSSSASVQISPRCANELQKADIYIELKDYGKARKALKKAAGYSKTATDEFEVSYTESQVYIINGNTQKALDILKGMKQKAQELDDILMLIKSDIGLGNYYYSIKNGPKSIASFYQALNLLQKNKNKELKSEALLGLAKIYIETGDYSDAKAYAQKALAALNEDGNKKLKADCFFVFSYLYENLGDYQSALYYKNKGEVLKDSLIDIHLLTLLNQLNNGESEQNQKQVIKQLEKENSSLNSIWEKEKNKGAMYLVISGLLFIFIIVLFLLFRAKNKVSRALKSKNLELEKLNGTKDKFFSIIAHDLKSPFNSLMGFSEMLSLHAETKSHEDIMEYSRIIHNSTRKLYALVETLLQWSRTQLGTTEYKPVKLDVRLVSSNIISILKINAEEKDIVISLKIDNNIVAWADKDLYSAVLRNLVSNAIKFSRIGSVISVTSEVKNKEVIISVTDSGVGISKENLEKIFRVDANVSTEGTLKEKGTGLGLVLCKEFVEINKGSIWAESQLEKGSTFKFTLPLANSYY